jgi:hypothetical protein
MDDGSDRCPRAIANICGCSCDRSGRSNAPNQRRENISDTLADELLIRIMACLRHSIGHHRGKEGFNRAKRSNCKRRPHELAHRFQRNIRKMPPGKAGRDPTEVAADRRYR